MNVRGVDLENAIDIDLLWRGSKRERVTIPYNYI